MLPVEMEWNCPCTRRGMAIRKLVFVVAMAILALSSFAIAENEHRATVVSRNGDRVTGNLDGVGNDTVYVRVSQNDQRKLPFGSVLLIDFVGGASGLPDTELSVAARPEHLMLLRDGQSMTGQFVGTADGTNNNEPHLAVFRTGGQERRVNLDQVARIYLGNYPYTSTAAQPGGPTTTPTGSVVVPGNATWVPANMMVRRGDRLVFSVSGQVQLSDASDVATAAGARNGRRVAGAPLPNELAGALIAKVGNSPPFAIGNLTTPILMPAGGQLFLGVNDDHVNDNQGEFVVQIQRLGVTRRQ